MSRFLSERFNGLVAYTPGEQPRDFNKFVKLNTNESPYPPSPRVLERVNSREVEKLNLYSDPTCKNLKSALAKTYGTESENIFVGNGSDEILSFFFMAFCDKEKAVAFPNISYGFYKVYAELYGIPYEEKPLLPDLTINCEDYYGIEKNIVIANPNAPTGISVSLESIEKMLVTNPDNIVLVDEAYVDFGGVSSIGLLEKYDNLLIVRTYSKSRSLAGARLGFAISSKEIIADLEKMKYSTNPYNINRLTLVAGEAALEDDEYYKKNCENIAKTREYTRTKLGKLGFVCTDSVANFIFAKTDLIQGEELYLELKKAGVLVRHFSNPIISDYLRITVGTKKQMDVLLEKTKDILERKVKGDA